MTPRTVELAPRERFAAPRRRPPARHIPRQTTHSAFENLRGRVAAGFLKSGQHTGKAGVLPPALSHFSSSSVIHSHQPETARRRGVSRGGAIASCEDMLDVVGFKRALSFCNCSPPGNAACRWKIWER